jgi:hypothetical protein
MLSRPTQRARANPRGLLFLTPAVFRARSTEDLLSAASRAVFGPASRPVEPVAFLATSDTDPAGGIDIRVRITTSL